VPIAELPGHSDKSALPNDWASVCSSWKPQ
jgi:hypothetical protein